MNNKKIKIKKKTQNKCPTGMWKKAHCIIREMQIKTTMNIIPLQVEWLMSKNTKDKSAGEDVEEREALHTVGGNAN
jgi:hypothetical protein